jgi:hypothetical protein
MPPDANIAEGCYRCGMKTVLLPVTLLVAALVFAGCAATPTRQSTLSTMESSRPPPRLQLTLSLPPTMSIIREEEISDAFAYRVSSSLHENGFRGRIRYVEFGDTPRPDVPVLAIHLYEWRVDRMGSVDCTFAATLQTQNGNRNLGIFHGTSFMMWPRHDWFARAQGFEEAAQDAVSALASRLEETGMLDRPRPR